MNSNEINTNVIQKIKHAWHYTSPPGLFELCMNTLVHNIDLILVRKSTTYTPSKHRQNSSGECVSNKKENKRSNCHHNCHRSCPLKLKYTLKEHVGPLPSCICESLLKTYSIYYLEQLGKMERDEYFKINRSESSVVGKLNPSSNSSTKKKTLISYYDLLMSLLSRPDKATINKIEYRQCFWLHSALEQRLLHRIQTSLEAAFRASSADSTDNLESKKRLFLDRLNTSYFRFSSSTLFYSLMRNNLNSNDVQNCFRSLRSMQPAHLSDKQLRVAIEQQSKCSYLDICPCMLTNKSIMLINKYLNKDLKYLRLQNCCNWHLKAATNETSSEENNNNMDDNHMNNRRRNSSILLLDNNNQSDADTDEEDEGESNDAGNFRFYNFRNYLNYRDSNEDDIDEDEDDEDNNDHEDDNLDDQKMNDEDDDDDDDDTGDFDAYLQEYVNHYENKQEAATNELKFETKLEDIIASNENDSDEYPGLENDSASVATGAEVAAETIDNAATNHDNDEQRHENKRKHHHHRHHHHRRHHCERHRHRCHRHKSKQNPNSRSNGNECKLFKLSNVENKQASLGDMDAYFSNKLIKRGKSGITSAKYEQKQRQRRYHSFKDTKSLIKLLIQDTIAKNNELAIQQTESTESKKKSSKLSTSFLEANNGSTSGISLLDQIKQKAAILAETKMIDKVSISSSNCDDYELNEQQRQQQTKENQIDEGSMSLDSYDEEDCDNESKKIEASNKNACSSMQNPFVSSLSIDSSSSSSSSLLYLFKRSDKLKEENLNRETSQSTNSSIYLSYDEDKDEEREEKCHTCSSSPLSSLNSSSISCSSSSSSCSSNSSSFESCSSTCSCTKTAASGVKLKRKTSFRLSAAETSRLEHHRHNHQNNRDKRMQRQQRLLEKVANLSSSPINVLQSIAAKALKFKLKNSETGQAAATGAAFSSNNMNETKTTNRLLRQYKFFKSTNIKSPKHQNSELPPSSSSSLATKSSSPLQNSQECKKLLNYKKTKRLKENEENDTATTTKATTITTTNGGKKREQQLSSNLFSVLKYWMSKRVDSTASPLQPRDIALNELEEDEEEKKKKKNIQLKSIKFDSAASSSSSSTSSEAFSLRSESRSNKENTKKRIKTAVRLTSSVETIKLSNLQHLSLRNLGINVIEVSTLNALLRNLSTLKYLDITNCCTGQLFRMSETDINKNGVQSAQNKPAGLLDGLLNLKNSLTHLLMGDLNVNDVQANFTYLLRLKRLKHLDISREKLPLNSYRNASLQLAKLVHHLNKLVSLDISGTNLGGPIIFKESEEVEYIRARLYEDLIDELNDYQRVKLNEIKTIKSGVSGLMFLNNENKELEFLGCFSCDNSVSGRMNLSALRVAGEESERSLYTSLQVYKTERPLFLLDALNHLFELYRDEQVEDVLLGGHHIMDTMEAHLENSRIQISGSASLFYVLKHCKEENIQFPPFYLRRLVKIVINGMEEHIDENPMRRNCVLIMCRLHLPDDVLFISDRLIKILLKIFVDYIDERNKNPKNVNNDRPEPFVLRTAMHLLNILACSVHGSDKSSVGLLAIPVAMDLIRTKTRFKEPDDILEVTWSFLWNITDETPENCKIFLDHTNGMDAFMECIKFKKPEIIRNMMGLLGNVAEVKFLRNRLCKNEFISTFRQLLFHSNDGIEIPYNSAGVLVHIMSDGAVAWDLAMSMNECTEHKRDNVIEDIETAIDKWDLTSERNINYRSFEPIFRLVNEYENPICQRWSCWALANLTTVYPIIYCPLFEKENGRLVLDRILNEAAVNDAIKNYARIVIKNVDSFGKAN